MNLCMKRAFEVVELTSRLGWMTVAVLGRQPGWTKASASRYLSDIAECGWLQKVNDKGFPKYVLGRKPLNLAPDLRL